MQTKADKIRSALKANPGAKVVDIARAINVNPQEIYALRYTDKKRNFMKARKARIKKTKADYAAFNSLANRMPSAKDVIRTPRLTLPEVKSKTNGLTADYLIALNRASNNAERAVRETEQLRDMYEKQAYNSLHPVATIVISVVAAVLVVIILGGIVR
jgi:hypothetical protein